MTPIERAGYIAHSMSASYQRKLGKAKSLIASHPDYAVSTSWGKDSMVLLHMAAQTHKDLVVLNARYPNPNERLEDMDRVRDLMLMRDDMGHVDYHEVHTGGEWCMYEMAGGGFAEAETSEQRKAAKWWKDTFTENMGKALFSKNRIGVFLGLRQEESHARRMNITMRGDDYTKKDGTSICLPLARWTGKDVWAYIALHDLPYMRIYDEAMCGRERARSGFVFATGGASAIRRHGVWNDWRKVYPKEFNAWLIRFPELDK